MKKVNYLVSIIATKQLAKLIMIKINKLKSNGNSKVFFSKGVVYQAG